MVNMSAVWDRAIEFVSDNLATLTPLAIGAIMLPLTLNDALAPLSDVFGREGDLILGLVTLALVLVAFWGRLAVLALALEPERTGGQAARHALVRLLPAILVSLVVLAALMLLVAPIFAILAAYGYDFAGAMAGEQVEVSPLAALWSTLYLILLVPPLAWIGARLSLIAPVIVGEGLGLSAIGRSVALTRGLTMKILGVAILYAVLAMVIALAVKTGIGSLLRLVIGGEGSVTLASVLTSVFTGTTAMALTVLASAFMGKLYLATLAREGAGGRA